MRRVAVLIAALSSTAAFGQAYRDGIHDTGGQSCFIYPAPTRLIADNPVQSTDLTINAADERVASMGQWQTSDGEAHVCSAAGGCTIGMMTGIVTFSTSGTTVVFGLEDLSTTTGPPAVPDETADVSGDFVQGTDSFGTGTWYDVPMETGSKTITPGDYGAITINMSVRNGSDSVGVRLINNGINGHAPLVVHKTSSAYAATNLTGNNIVVFDDGALGWIEGTGSFSATSVTGFDSANTPDEYGVFIIPQFDMQVTGVWYNGYVVGSADAEFVLYGDALGTPVALGTISLDHNIQVSNSAARISQYVFQSPVYLRRGGVYVIALRPTTTNDANVVQITAADASYLVTWGGENATKATRSDQSGAFTETATQSLYMGVKACGISYNGRR